MTRKSKSKAKIQIRLSDTLEFFCVWKNCSQLYLLLGEYIPDSGFLFLPAFPKKEKLSKDFFISVLRTRSLFLGSVFDPLGDLGGVVPTP